MRFHTNILSMYEMLSSKGLWGDKFFAETILQNNEKVTMWQDLTEQIIWVECENKPADMPQYGVEWIEADE